MVESTSASRSTSTGLNPFPAESGDRAMTQSTLCSSD
jgi:hypothetical protein